jgi:hypothetical protein
MTFSQIILYAAKKLNFTIIDRLGSLSLNFARRANKMIGVKASSEVTK